MDDAGRIARPGLATVWLAIVAAAVLAAQLPRLEGPFTDGQSGNCAAMFALFARNEQALGGWIATRGLPVLAPVPPRSLDEAEVYGHHPPGLPWLVMAAARLPVAVEPAARLVALMLFLAGCLLAADLAARLAGQRAGLAAGLLMAWLPAGQHHGLLVNYETAAVPALLLLVRALLTGTGSAAAAAGAAALADWIALAPLAWAWRSVPRRRFLAAAATGGAAALALLLAARNFAPRAPAETLAQAVGASFLAPDFRWAEWAPAMGEHLRALYGWALLPAAIALPLLARRPALQRRTLLWLLATGALNVLVFARHATGHEHFSLVLLPYVALATAMLLFPRDEAAAPPASIGALLALALVLASFQQVRREAPARATTRQAGLAARFAAVSDLGAVYLRPEGASLVFLHGAMRHVAPQPVGSLEEALAAARAYRERFAQADLRACIALVEPEAGVPSWLEALGPPRESGGVLLWELGTAGG